MSNSSNHHRFAIENFEWLDRFVPNRWWPGGWLQTISIKAIRPTISVDSWDGAVEFQVAGDQTPPDQLCGYYLPTKCNSKRATVVIMHGMGGDAKSGYMCSMAASLLDAGYSVILWNNRGAGDSAGQCSGLHHPGYTDDIRRLVDHLRERHPQWTQNGLAAIAFSLGANVLLKYLAQSGEDSGFAAAVSVSAPLDMEITSKNLRCGFNKLFDRYLLRQQRKEVLRDCADITDEQRDAIENAGSVWELDDKFTAPHLGYDGAKDFYQANSAIYVLDQIRTPTLLLHAADDPVVDVDVFTSRDWLPDGPLFPGLAESGGHTGFLDRDGKRWHERASVRFLDSMLG
ncbi:MAG: alpha/beta fold hydrolase [Pirellulaceae bacterium]|nr:alpha/beta fold hydrolase [Pirellulaceae bacterium]